MILVRETTQEDLKLVQQLWADGDVMRFVGFPEGLHESDEAMQRWYARIEKTRPMRNHFSVFEDGVYCGESFYAIDAEHGHSAALDIKLLKAARGRGIATRALSHAIEAAFQNGAESVWVDPDPKNVKAVALYERLGFERKPMPDHLAGDGEVTSLYMERRR